MSAGPINFCHPGFLPSVTSDRISADSYEITNLVTDTRPSNKGFILESFLRPPVNIYFKFPSNIDIDRVIINGTVGAQKSCSYEIYTAQKDRKNESFDERWDSKTSWPSLDRESYNNEIFTQVGKVFQSSSGEVQGIVCFKNNRFRPTSNFSNLISLDSKFANQKCLYSELRAGRNVRTLSDVSHLGIRITQAAACCVPAIRWVEVWGQPSHSAPPQDNDKILQIYKQLKTPVPQSKSDLQTKAGVTKSVSAREARSDVPSEFLDPITCEIMMLPLLLPSGQSIDQATLEKHNEVEAKWGRKPNNPFTGVPFRASCKPVPNTALKLRIDNYLLSEPNISNDLVSTRTLGTAKDIVSTMHKPTGALQTSVLLGKGNSSAGKNEKSVTESERKRSYPPPPKRACIPGSSASLDDALDMLLNDLPSYHPSPSTSLSTTTPYINNPDLLKRKSTPLLHGTSNNEGKRAKNTNMSCKRQKTQVSEVIDLTEDDLIHLDGSLDSVSSSNKSRSELKTRSGALGQTSNPAHASISWTDWRNSSASCVFCSERLDVGIMYKLACDDLVCRTCITSERRSSQIVKCKKCGRESTSRDIVKVHR